MIVPQFVDGVRILMKLLFLTGWPLPAAAGTAAVRAATTPTTPARRGAATAAGAAPTAAGGVLQFGDAIGLALRFPHCTQP